MKKSFLLLPLIAGLAYVTLSSNSAGYPANRTGSDGNTATTGCGGAGCHGSASTSGISGTILFDSAGTGTMVTSYKPGVTYIIRFGAANTVIGSTLPKFGFQVSTVSATTNLQAGRFGAPLPGSDTVLFGGRLILTHTTPWASSGTGGLGSVDSTHISWTAPAAGTGTVKVYAVINAVDNDNSATASDKWNSITASITEQVDHTGVGAIANGVSIVAFPNPASANLSLQLNNAQAGTYNVLVYDMSGKVMATQSVDVACNSSVSVIDMHSFAAGMYHVAVEKDGLVTTQSVIKK